MARWEAQVKPTEKQPGMPAESRLVRPVALMALLLAACLVPAFASAQAPAEGVTYDLVIANGRVMDPESGLDAVRNVGISDGRIRAGADADITVFDPRRVKDRATFDQPLQYSEGIQYVLVNGVAVIEHEQLVGGVFPGRAARAPIADQAGE
jgi:N-acyl-D-aspartate/D-glutamate deacylase